MPSKFKVGDLVVVKGTKRIKTIDSVDSVQLGSRSRSVYTTKKEDIYDWKQSFYSNQLEKLKTLNYEEMM